MLCLWGIYAFLQTHKHCTKYLYYKYIKIKLQAFIYITLILIQKIIYHKIFLVLQVSKMPKLRFTYHRNAFP